MECQYAECLCTDCRHVECCGVKMWWKADLTISSSIF
jgi:hypothetical protein